MIHALYIVMVLGGLALLTALIAREFAVNRPGARRALHELLEREATLNLFGWAAAALFVAIAIAAALLP